MIPSHNYNQYMSLIITWYSIQVKDNQVCVKTTMSFLQCACMSIYNITIVVYSLYKGIVNLTSILLLYFSCRCMMNTSCILSLLQFVVYTDASTRVGSKHIPVMMISYSPVTEVNTYRLPIMWRFWFKWSNESNEWFTRVVISNEWFTRVVIASMFFAFLTDSMHITINYNQHNYDNIMYLKVHATTTEITKLD